LDWPLPVFGKVAPLGGEIVGRFIVPEIGTAAPFYLKSSLRLKIGQNILEKVIIINPVSSFAFMTIIGPNL
jgi:hypothetical protein